MVRVEVRVEVRVKVRVRVQVRVRVRIRVRVRVRVRVRARARVKVGVRVGVGVRVRVVSRLEDLAHRARDRLRGDGKLEVGQLLRLGLDGVRLPLVRDQVAHLRGGELSQRVDACALLL